MKNNYLLIDYGNSCIKAAIYDGNKIIEEHQVDKTKNANLLLSKFRFLKTKPLKIIEVATSTPQYVKPFNALLAKRLKTTIKIVSKNDFKGILDFSNLDKKMLIGGDILCVATYIHKTIKTGCGFSFGSVYFGVVVKNRQLKAAYLLPSIIKGMRYISENTMISDDLLPDIFNKQTALDTFGAFSAAGNLAIEGFVDNVVKYHKINTKNVLLSGGDCLKFKNITKKYKIKHNLVIHGLVELLKTKKW